MRGFKFFLILFLFFGTSGCKEQIIHDLSETEVNKIITRLGAIHIRPEKIRQPDGRWAISVNQSDVYGAISYLDNSRMLNRGANSLYKKDSLTASREERRFRFERALSQEIETTLTGMSGVLEARVHLNLAPVDPLFGRPFDSDNSGSGSVLLVVGPDYNFPDERVAALVAGASGIGPDLISVLVNRAFIDNSQSARAMLKAPEKGQRADEVRAGSANSTPRKLLTPNQKLTAILFSLLFVSVALLYLALRLRKSRALKNLE